MKLITRALAGAILLAGIGAASAQQQTVNEYVAGLLAESVDESTETQVGSIQLGEIAEGDTAAITFEIEADVTYLIYAACDDDCSDIDLYGVNEESGWEGSDEEGDATPLLLISPEDEDGSVTISVEMAACETEVCVFAVGLYAQNE